MCVCVCVRACVYTCVFTGILKRSVLTKIYETIPQVVKRLNSKCFTFIMNVLDYDMCAFSINGQYMAAVLSNYMIIKNHPFSELYIKTRVDYIIDHLEWNNTSDTILCAELSRGIIQLYDVHSKKWIFTLTCGYFKFIATEWIGHTKILITLEFHMALAIFDLLKKSIKYIEIPKPIWPCIVFDNNGTHMFVVSKINGYEKLLMIHSHSLDRVIHIQDIIGLCDGINKSPDNRFLCIFNKHKLAILNFHSGNVIGSIEYFLLNTVSWAPNSEYLALGNSLGNIIVLASANKFNVQFKLCINSINEDCDLFIELNKALIKKKPSINYFNNNTKKIASITWSFDCNYLSTFEVNSTFLYIWEKYKLICVVKFCMEIKGMQWCWSENKLSVVCGTDLIFFWTKEQTKLQKSPKLMNGKCLLVSTVSWSSNDKDLILSDGKKYLLFTN